MQIEENLENLPYHDMHITSSGRIKVLKPILPKIRKGKILDAGCSTGLTTFELMKFYFDSEVIGLDLEEKILKKGLKENPQLKKEQMKQGNFYILQNYFPQNHFDLILMMNNLYFSSWDLEIPQIINILSNISQCLKPNGHILISVDSYNYILAQLNQEKTKYKTISQYGFNSEKIHYGKMSHIFGIY